MRENGRWRKLGPDVVRSALDLETFIRDPDVDAGAVTRCAQRFSGGIVRKLGPVGARRRSLGREARVALMERRAARRLDLWTGRPVSADPKRAIDR